MSDRAVMPLSDYVSACDNIREKTETTEAIKSGELRKKVDEVFEAGKNATWDALRKTICGTDIVRIDDISPIEHEMSVKVQGKNLYNIRDCEVTTVTKNGVTADVMEDGQLHVYGTVTDTSNYTILQFPIQYTKRKTYPAGTAIGWRLNGNINQIYTQFGLRNSAGTILNIQQGAKTTTEPRTLEYMTVVVSPNYTESIDLIVPTQLEYGTTATEYAPYIPDISAVKVSRLGKNVFDFNSASGLFMAKGNDGSFTQNKEDTRANLQLVLNAYKNGAYVKQLCSPVDVFSIGRWSCTFEYDETFDTVRFGHNGTTTNVMCIFPMPPVPKGDYAFSVLLTNVTQGSFSWKDIQIEAGMETEYEPYIQPTEYTPDAEGIVQGVTSLYPCTMLMSDTDGVIIETTYNQELSEVDDIPERIEDIYVEGQMVGHTQCEREMWDYILDYGAKYDFNKAFSQTGFEYIRPPYKIVPTYNYSLNQTFVESKKLKKVEAAYFDFSKKQRGTSPQSGLYWTFATCPALEEVEDIGLQPDYSLSCTFLGDGNLKRIAMLRVDEQTQYESAFGSCANLEEVRFKGVIGQNGLDFSPCTKLDSPSTHNIFTHLKDFRQPIIISTDLTNIQTPTVIGKGTLRAGQQYTWRYYMSLYPGWMVDDPTKNPIYDPKKELSPEETLIISTAQEIIVNDNTYIGFKAECRNFPDDVDGGFFIYVYQDGENIVIYPVVGGISSADTIELTLMVASETRTITMPKAVKDNGNATPEDIAEATDGGWTIAWAE